MTSMFERSRRPSKRAGTMAAHAWRSRCGSPSPRPSSETPTREPRRGDPAVDARLEGARPRSVEPPARRARRRPSRIEAYGKGAIIGTAGDIEYGALWHEAGGWSMREVLGGTKAIVPSSKMIGTVGTQLQIPLGHVHAAFVRSHLMTTGLSIHDAPATRRDRLRADDGDRAAGARARGRPHCRGHQGRRRPSVSAVQVARRAPPPDASLEDVHDEVEEHSDRPEDQNEGDDCRRVKRFIR